MSERPLLSIVWGTTPRDDQFRIYGVFSKPEDALGTLEAFRKDPLFLAGSVENGVSFERLKDLLFEERLAGLKPFIDTALVRLGGKVLIGGER